MFTGTPDELRRREQQAADYAQQIADILGRIDALEIGTTTPGRISGPGFTICGGHGRWTVQH